MMAAAMLSVAEALHRVLADFAALESESIPTEVASGRVLAESVWATLDLPPFPNSSMDGYAVRAVDVRAASAESPAVLTVIGDIPAGTAPNFEITPGTAARIMTGAPVPRGSDAVVPVEATTDSRSRVGGALPQRVQVLQSFPAGAHIRLTGEDIRAGDEVLKAGTPLRPYDVGVLAAVGQSRVRVVRRPRTAILSTGDELVNVNQTPGPGQIRDSNSYALAALVRQYGGRPLVLGVAGDHLDAVYQKLVSAVEQKADVIVSSAGVSVGAYDVVKMAVERDGSLDFWKVRMRPGKPLAYGHFKGVPFFGLPGNPVSAVVGFELFVRPALLKLAGRRRLKKPQIPVVLRDTFTSDGRESYLRAVVERDGETYVARGAGAQGSNILSALTRANALVIMPEGMMRAEPGTMLKAWMLDWPEEVF